MVKRKKFGIRYYDYLRTHKSKTDANKDAATIRKKSGLLAKVVGKDEYEVYIAEPKKKKSTKRKRRKR